MMLLHGATTLVSFQQDMHPFKSPNLLFYAAWPMQVTCMALLFLGNDAQLATLNSQRPWEQGRS